MDTGTLFGDDKPVWLDQELPGGKGFLTPWSEVNRVDIWALTRSSWPAHTDSL